MAAQNCRCCAHDRAGGTAARGGGHNDEVLTGILVALAMSVSLTGIAHADSATVTGSGDIQRLVAKNGTEAVVVKIFGAGGKCDIRYVAATLRGTDGVRYKASGGCYPGGQWILGLSKGTKLVSCGSGRLAYNATGGFWRFTVPRSCLGKLTDKIKVSGELTFSAMPGEAGPTTWVRRG